MECATAQCNMGALINLLLLIDQIKTLIDLINGGLALKVCVNPLMDLNIPGVSINLGVNVGTSGVSVTGGASVGVGGGSVNFGMSANSGSGGSSINTMLAASISTEIAKINAMIGMFSGGGFGPDLIPAINLIASFTPDAIRSYTSGIYSTYSILARIERSKLYILNVTSSLTGIPGISITIG